MLGSSSLINFARHTHSMPHWMDFAFSWLLISWFLVGAICYYVLNRLGVTTTADSPPDQILSATTTSATSSTTPSSSSHQIGIDQQNVWLNEIIEWLFCNYRRTPDSLNAWIRSLNDAAKKVTTPSNCEILFEGFGEHSKMDSAPKLRNVRVERGPQDHLTLHSDLLVPAVHLKLVSSQRLQDRLLVSNYDAHLFDLHGEIQARLACISNKLFLMVCFNGRPEMDVQLINIDSNAVGRVDANLVEDAIRRCIVSAVANITLTGTTPDEQQTASKQHGSSMVSPITMPVEEVFRRLHQSQVVTTGGSGGLSTLPNKLRVKVIRAQRLGGGGDIDVHEPYVVIEMDEPARKCTTSRGLNMSPYWEESFEFDLTPASEEILFEVYEGMSSSGQHDQHRFLGLAIVGFEEIRRSGEAIHSLTLQGRPYRNDSVSGTLTVQFDFYHDPNVSVIGKRVESFVVKNSRGEITETVATSKRPLYDPHDNFDSHDIVPSRTTTVLVKSVSQYLQQQSEQQQQLQAGVGADKKKVNIASGAAIDMAAPPPLRTTPSTFPPPPPDQHRPQPPPNQTKVMMTTRIDPQHNLTSDGRPLENPIGDINNPSRGRSKERKSAATFFGELKNRLTGRRHSTSKTQQQQARRAQSMDSAQFDEAVSLPASRDASQTRHPHEGTSRSFYHETHSMSGRSGESSKSMYQHSTLLLELTKNNAKKYYLIPPSVISEAATMKLLKRGKKLHIFNEHTFVAVKVRGGTPCNVCGRRIGPSFSKRGYQCRDCLLVCHKNCHYKTDSFCPRSNVALMEIEKDMDWDQFLSHFQLEEYISMDGV